ncbi:MAG: SDR family oxidoreductase [Erysipelothrix sp.]|nr:SDR family oxidoreductase [Erysipelothrix sp.]
MKILVTGGAGFIGSHLCERLLKDGHQILCIDNLFTGSIENIRGCLSHSNFQFVQHDITEPLAVDGIDQIFNLACPASPIHYQNDPIKTIQTNVLGSNLMLNLAHANKARILQASTSEVYGDPMVHPQREDYWGNVNPIGIRSCYDEGKRLAETLFFDYHRQMGVDIKVIRIFNTYGPNMQENDGRVISNFIVQSLRGEDITIYGNGSQTRSFCYISDLIEGMVRFMNSTSTTIGPINIGNPHEISIIELADRIISLTNSKSVVVYKSMPNDDPKKRKPDIKLASSILNWQPQIDLDSGLLETIAYFKKKSKMNC